MPLSGGRRTMPVGGSRPSGRDAPGQDGDHPQLRIVPLDTRDQRGLVLMR
jgi:hypothetical protein